MVSLRVDKRGLARDSQSRIDFLLPLPKATSVATWAYSFSSSTDDDKVSSLTRLL